VVSAAGSAMLAGVDISGLMSAFGGNYPAANGEDGRAQLLNARASLGDQMQSAENDLALAGLATADTPEAAISGLSVASQSTQQFSALASANAYLGRADSNLGALEGWL